MPVFHEPSSQGLRNFPRPAQPCNLEPSTRSPALCPQQRHRLERRKSWRSLWPRRCRRPESSLRSCPSILSLVSLLSGSLLRSQPLTGYVRRRTLELNKYAPEGAKGSPILDQVLEVSERGRSLGIVLYGAQQFLSAVHDRVTGNCSTTLLGRTNASEMAERSYRFLNRDIKAAATRLEKGQLILNHAVFREPVKIKFPAITCDRRRLGECSAMIL